MPVGYMVVQAADATEQQVTLPAQLGQHTICSGMLRLGAVGGTQHGVGSGTELVRQHSNDVLPPLVHRGVAIAQGPQGALGLLTNPARWNNFLTRLTLLAQNAAFMARAGA